MTATYASIERLPYQATLSCIYRSTLHPHLTAVNLMEVGAQNALLAAPAPPHGWHTFWSLDTHTVRQRQRPPYAARQRFYLLTAGYFYSSTTFFC